MKLLTETYFLRQSRAGTLEAKQGKALLAGAADQGETWLCELRKAGLLVEIGFDDVARGGCGQITMLAAFEKYSEHDLGIFTWCESYEPAVVFVVGVGLA